MNVDFVEHSNLGIRHIDRRMWHIKAFAPSFDGYDFGRNFLQRVDVACGSGDAHPAGRDDDVFHFIGRCGLSLEARFDNKFALNVAP